MYLNRNSFHTAFETLRSRSPKTEPNHITYCKPEEIISIQEVPSNIYAEIVKSMTISCVDAFVYNFEKRAYLLPKGKGDEEDRFGAAVASRVAKTKTGIQALHRMQSR